MHVSGANSLAAIAVGSRGVSPVPWYYHPSTTPPPPAAHHYAHGAHQQYHGVLPFYPAAAATYGYVHARRSQLRIPIPRPRQGTFR
jgi:hypothetical protein